MLEQLHSGDFSPHLGKRCLLECGEVTIETVLASVSDKPQSRHPMAAAVSRTPFSLQFRGAPDCPWSDGVFTLKIEGMEEIPGVFVNRVMNLDPTPASVFQAVFN